MTRILLEVAVDLDELPGAFHTPESAQDHVQAMLHNMIPHYNPVVKILMK